MIDLDDFREYTSDTQLSEPDAERAISTGIALVDVYLGAAAVDVPDAVLDQAYLLAASALYSKRTAPQGVTQFASPDGAPVYVARDPLAQAYPLLRPYKGLGIA